MGWSVFYCGFSGSAYARRELGAIEMLDLYEKSIAGCADSHNLSSRPGGAKLVRTTYFASFLGLTTSFFRRSQREAVTTISHQLHSSQHVLQRL